MKKYFTTKVRVILVVAALAAIVTLGFIILRPGEASPMNNVVSMVMNPLKNASAIVVEKAETLYDYIFSYEMLAAENEQLRVEIAQQNQDIRNSQIYKEEN